MDKIKILVVGDKSVANTGFAIYKKNLLKRLLKNEKYEVAELAFAGVSAEKSKVPWRYYPCIPDQTEPDFEEFQKNPGLYKNGSLRWNETVLHFKPDIVLCVQDVWMSSYIATSPYKEFYHVCAAVPVDSHPQTQAHLKMYSSMDTLVPYTQYAKDCLGQYNLESSDPIGVGVDSDVFKPINKERCREQLRLPKTGTAFGFIARNQPRKRIPELFSALRKYIDKTNDKSAFLILHTTFPERNVGWNIPQHLLDYGLGDNVYFTYRCEQTGQCFMSKFKDILMLSPFTGNYTAIHNNSSICLEESYVAMLYNAMDLYIQCANCEGFGVPIIEAAACETRVLSIDYSAMGEVTRNVGGDVVKPAALEYCIDIKTERAVVDTDALCDKMVNYKSMKRASRKKAIEYYSWDSIVQKWEVLIDGLKHNNSNWDCEERKQEVINIDGGKYSPTQFVLSVSDKIPECMGMDDFSEINNVTKASMTGQNSGAFMTNIVNRYGALLQGFQKHEIARLNNVEEKSWMK